MKCWECKKLTTKATMVGYLEIDTRGEAINSKTRDICADCYPKLTFNACHFVEVERIGRRTIL